jgi:PAS domain S-box-containing protein
MNPLIIALIVGLATGGLISFLLSVLGWWNRDQPGIFWFAVYACLVACWSILGLAAVLAETAPRTTLFAVLGNGFGLAVSVTWILFIVGYLGYETGLPRRPLEVGAATAGSLYWVLYALSYETELLVEGFETGDWNGLEVATFEPTLAGIPAIVFGLGLFVPGLALVVRAIAIEDRVHSAQGMIIFAGTVVPVLAAVLIAGGLFPAGLPVVPLAAALSTSLYAVAFLRYDMFSLVPATERIGIEQAFDDLEAGVVVTNDDGIVLQVNGLGERILDVERERAVGGRVEELLAGFDCARDALPATLRTDGRIYRVSDSAVTDDDGDTIGHSLLFVDVTDRNGRYRQRLSVALDAADAGVWEWDRASDEIVMGDSMEQLVGVEPGSFDGTYEAFRERVHPTDRERFDAVFGREITLEEELDHEFRIRTDDDTTCWVATRARPVRRGGTTRLIGVSIDVTERKERERMFERLYRGTRELLAADSSVAVCERTVEVVESVLDHPTVGVHLYDRETEALEPAAVSERATAQLRGGAPRYTDRDTVVWKAYEDASTVRIDDTETFEGSLPREETTTRSAVILPVGVHGVIITSAPEPERFDDQDVYFLQLLARLVEVTLDRTTNEQGLTAVQQTVRDALAADSHEEMASIVLDTIPEALDLPVAGIWKYRPAEGQLEPLGITDRARMLFDDAPVFPAGESIAWQTFETGSTAVVSDVSNHPEAYNPDTPVEGEIVVPIGEFGVLTAGSTYKNSFTELDAEILEILAANLEVVSQTIDQRQDLYLLDQVFARVLRHNVRNELAPILGYANQIAEESDGPVEAYANDIVTNCKKLERTSEHAREMRGIVRNRTRTTEISLATQVRAAVEQVEGCFPEGALEVTVEDTATVQAHPELESAIRHLVRNGFEHNTSERPRVEVTVTDTDDGPTVEVADNGPGIAPSEVEILEEHRESALEHGSGAGLWIVDRVVEYSEANLAFDTTDGTSVAITFPRDRREQVSD